MKNKVVDINSRRNDARNKRKEQQMDQMKDRFKNALSSNKDESKRKLLNIFKNNKPKR